MSLIDWETHLESAQTEYAKVSHPLPTPQREAAAETFQDWIKRFQDGGEPALETLKAQITNKGSLRRHTVARLIVEIPSEEASTFLLETFIKGHHQLSHGILRRIDAAFLPPDQPWMALKYLQTGEKCALLEALLREPTDTGRRFVERLLSSKEHSPGIVKSVIKAVSNWNEPELLWQIVQSDPLDQSDYPLWLRKDSRVEAAFYLGLAGDRKAVNFLMSIADDPKLALMDQTAFRLAQLAWPWAKYLLKHMLKELDSWDASIVFDGVVALSLAQLGWTVLYLISFPVKDVPVSGPPPIPDRAIRVLDQLTGRPLPEDMVERETGTTLEVYTEATRRQALIHYQRVLEDFDINRRYYRGELLTLEHLAADLLSRHQGPRRNAVYNLRTITGENHRYDPDDDLIANLPAIRAWRERAKNPTPLSPGGWAFAGSPLNYPVV